MGLEQWSAKTSLVFTEARDWSGQDWKEGDRCGSQGSTPSWGSRDRAKAKR